MGPALGPTGFKLPGLSVLRRQGVSKNRRSGMEKECRRAV